jgi:transposase
LFFCLTPGARHEAAVFEPLFLAFLAHLAALNLRGKLHFLAGDKGYDSVKIVELCRAHQVEPVIPKRAGPQGQDRQDPHFDRQLYRRRNIIERCLGWLKEFRRVATRYEKLAATFSAMIQLAIIRRLGRTCVN